MSKDKLQWLKAAGIRAVKTIAQTAVATIGTATVLGSVDWKMVVSASVLSGVLSLLTSVHSRRFLHQWVQHQTKLKSFLKL